MAAQEILRRDLEGNAKRKICKGLVNWEHTSKILYFTSN